MILCRLQDLLSWNHHAKIDDFKVITLQYDRHNIFSNIVYIALHGGDNNFSLGLGVTGYPLLFFNIGHEVRDSGLHNAG